MYARLTALSVLATAALLTPSRAVPQLDKTYWNSNWNAMYFEINGNTVSSEYIYDDGVITATLSGDTLRGFWREYNNPQSCGPDGKWSGRMAFLFDSAGTSFTGDWNYCGDSASLNLKGTGWTGTLRPGGYTESECAAAGRNWCTDKCQVAACGEALTEAKCLESGRFWCDGVCSLTQCATSIRRLVRPARRGSALPMSQAGLFDLRGCSIEGKGPRAPGLFLAP